MYMKKQKSEMAVLLITLLMILIMQNCVSQ